MSREKYKTYPKIKGDPSRLPPRSSSVSAWQQAGDLPRCTPPSANPTAPKRYCRLREWMGSLGSISRVIHPLIESLNAPKAESLIGQIFELTWLKSRRRTSHHIITIDVSVIANRIRCKPVGKKKKKNS